MQEKFSKFKGAILGHSYADALGSGYEFFKGTIGEEEEIVFFELPRITRHSKYEWTDDFAMTYLTLEATQGKGFEYEINYKKLEELFLNWYKNAPDKGLHTFNVLSETEKYLQKHPNELGVMKKKAKEITDANPMSAGNGGLMRMSGGIFATQNKGFYEIWDIGYKLASLTHPHRDSVRCCGLYLLFLTHFLNSDTKSKVIEGNISNQNEFKEYLFYWLTELEAFDIRNQIYKNLETDLKVFNPNRYVVTSFVLSILSIYQTWSENISPEEHYLAAIHKCIRVGDDTDTTSAITGALIGAIYGEQCIPNDVDKIYGYAGESFEKVTYQDVVNKIESLFR